MATSRNFISIVKNKKLYKLFALDLKKIYKLNKYTTPLLPPYHSLSNTK